jgi:hypothetical protein
VVSLLRLNSSNTSVIKSRVFILTSNVLSGLAETNPCFIFESHYAKVVSIHLYSDTSYSTIIVKNDCSFWVSTAIIIGSPGKNSKSFVLANGIIEENFFMATYDEWGSKIFKTTDYNISAP